MRRGRPPGRDLRAASATLRDEYADRSARASRTFRAACPATPTSCCPENGFNVARALVGTEGTCVTMLEAKVRAGAQPARARARGARLPRHLPGRRPRAGRQRAQPIALEGSTTSHRLHEEEAHEARGPRAAADGRRLAVGRVRRRRPTRKRSARREALHGRPCRRKRHVDEARRPTRASKRCCGRCASRASAPPPCSRRAGQLARLGGLGRRARGRRRLPARPAQALRPLRLRRRAVRPLRPGLHPLPDRLRPVTADGIAAWLRFLDEAADLVAKYGGSLSGEHGDGQARGELLPKMFGDEHRTRRSASSRHLGPAGQDEPRQGRRRLPARREPAPGPDYRPWEPETHFSFAATTTARSRTRRSAASGVGKCRSHDGKGTMCPSYMVTQRGEALDARPRAPAVRDARRRRRSRTAGATRR